MCVQDLDYAGAAIGWGVENSVRKMGGKRCMSIDTDRALSMEFLLGIGMPCSLSGRGMISLGWSEVKYV